MSPEIAPSKVPLTCLLLASYEAETSPWLIENLQLVTERLGITLIRFDTEVAYGGLVSDAVLQIPRTIESADVIIADITGANPNVMYELGFAHALKKPVFPIARRDESRIPSDLQGYLYYPYEPSLSSASARDFQNNLYRWLHRTLGDRLK